MKKIFMAILLALPFAAMSQGKSSIYTASYSSNFTMADPSYSDKVLTLWKDFEDNALEKHGDLVSDTVTMMIADGPVVKGKAANLAGLKEFRSSLKNYKVTVEAWMSVKSVDKGENFVCIWGNEDFTDKDGKHINRRLHEVWGFNKDGKVSLLMQYAGAGRSM
ncbi:MAG: nuclear transport factor 2 family protein [Mucilaginibacter sp.]|nr:nuclear transport factor 2 family protein [Mucilaginibacter sp.]